MREVKVVNGLKLCSRCKQEKEVSCFGKSKIIKCGLRGECNECRKIVYATEIKPHNNQYFREYYLKNKENIQAKVNTPEFRKKVREYYRKNADKLRERNRKYKYPEIRKREKEKHKLHIAARKKLNRAIARGQFERPSKCQECGSMNDIEAHHEDYRFAYQVEWLCVICHNKRHYKYE